MSQAATLVWLMLRETGEADQDYDHATFDSIVQQLANAGYPGGFHKEFDKYQGVYLRVPGVDKFWADYSGGGGLALVPENDPRKEDANETTEIPVEVDWGSHKADITYLLAYIEERYRSKFVQRKAQKDAETFIDRAYRG